MKQRWRGRGWWLPAAITLTLVACASSGKPAGRRHVLVDVEYPPPVLTPRGTEVGVSSWYGPGFHGQLTASGERYDQHALTAAHRTLPLGTRVEVRNLANGRSVRVRINDRGPYKMGRVLDLSRAAADVLGMIGPGTADVEIRVVDARYRRWPTVRYSVQIGAFRQRAEADAAGVAAARVGENAYLKLTRRDDFPWSVRVGPFDEREDALTARDRLERDGFPALLVEEDPPSDALRGDASASASPPGASAAY